MTSQGSIRIIGGAWRGRNIKVTVASGLRPTPSRLRETLFNWWRDHTPGARVLDLFAGTGILGFEAVSRGAEYVAMVERQSSVYHNLRSQADLMAVPNKIEVHHSDAISWLRRTPAKCFDLVCIDPPFAQFKNIYQCCRLLLSDSWLKPASIVYTESPCVLQPPDGFTVFRQSRVGQVYGCLWSCDTVSKPSGDHIACE